ncbi:hypothetical protein ACIU1J_19405 [Azospirillum doebereinerae]|uniref:hypothetical protein n=1 Tax=Azospirillum doebereinerae TaxID=92933 RepID=UPI001EE5488B|nr:hypothetical protein [Azospirillum doebereinerae]MCG5242297.1 hypothetical protein [Azospirillum doebereinerae]
MAATVIAFPGRRAVSDAERVQAAKAKCDAALAFDGDPSPENRERLISAHRRLAEVRHAGVPGLVERDMVAFLRIMMLNEQEPA